VTGADGKALVPATAAYALVKSDATSATFRAEEGGVTISKTFSVNLEHYGISLLVELKAAQGSPASFRSSPVRTRRSRRRVLRSAHQYAGADHLRRGQQQRRAVGRRREAPGFRGALASSPASTRSTS